MWQRDAAQSSKLYQFGKNVMDTADPRKREKILRLSVTRRGSSFAPLAARPLRIRNFQAITIGISLRWTDSATG